MALTTEQLIDYIENALADNSLITAQILRNVFTETIASVSGGTTSPYLYKTFRISKASQLGDPFVLEIGDFVEGVAIWDSNLFINRAVYNGGDKDQATGYDIWDSSIIS